MLFLKVNTSPCFLGHKEYITLSSKQTEHDFIEKSIIDVIS